MRIKARSCRCVVVELLWKRHRPYWLTAVSGLYQDCWLRASPRNPHTGRPHRCHSNKQRREPTYVTHVTRASRPALGNASHVLHVRFRHVAHVAWCSHRSFRQAKSSCATCVLDTSQTSAGPYIWKDWGGTFLFGEQESRAPRAF